MNVELTDRAKIALDHLQPLDKKGAERMILQLSDFPNGLTLRGKVHKATPINGDVFIARASQRFRIVFREEQQMLLILDIVHHDRLQNLFNLERGRQ
jgi:hypothetical protein